MHLYRWDPAILAALISQFTGGQCLTHTRGKVLYRGKIKEILYFRDRRLLQIFYVWLASAGVIKKEFDKKVRITWIPVQDPLSGDLFQEFHFFAYDYQDKKNRTNRENRLKLYGWREHCRLYLPNDPINIVKPEIE